jgi:hypothetical protein
MYHFTKIFKKSSYHIDDFHFAIRFSLKQTFNSKQINSDSWRLDYGCGSAKKHSLLSNGGTQGRISSSGTNTHFYTKMNFSIMFLLPNKLYYFLLNE